MDGQGTTALIDSGAQVSNVGTTFCKDLALQIQPLGQLLELERTGGAAIPYLWFVEVNLQILVIRNYSEDVLLLVIPTMTYSETVPVVVGSKIINKALSLMTSGELLKVTTTWQQAHFGAVMLGLLQLSHPSSNKNRIIEGEKCSSQEVDPVELQRFCLSDIWVPVCTPWKVTILLFSTVSVHTNSGVKGHCMWVHVLMELMPDPQLPAAVAPMATYGELCPGSSRVPICLCKLSTCAMEIPTKAVVGQVIPANQVQLVVHPTRTTEESKQNPQKVGSWRLWNPRSQRVVWIRAETGQGTTAQMGAPVCMWGPGPGQNCSDQA